MKIWLTFILLLITIAGTFFPCCLVDGCNAEEAATAKSDNKNKQEGSCSPFFSCASCSGFAEMVKPVLLNQPMKENQVHHETLVVFNLTSFASSFWQPPRWCYTS